MRQADTIYALATPAGRGAVAIVRVSGPASAAAVLALAQSLPRARVGTLKTLRDATGDVLDEALVLWFPAPGSYTGEDTAEFQLHGGRAVVEGVMFALGSLPGLRLAEPGEFTRRAFQNGRLDLAQAEAVADLVDAETDAQRRQALGQLGGALSRRHEAWRALLLDASAWLEAAVDFPDEDLPEVIEARAGPVLLELEGALVAAVDDSARGDRIRSGYRIALVGQPNAGKSSILNALAGRDAAIVTEIAGTTRDVIEVPMTLGGFAVVLGDTAGLRDTTDVIEAEGVRRAQAWASAAALRVWIVDPTQPAAARPAVVQDEDLRVVNKIDLIVGASQSATGVIEVSAFDPEDMAGLKRLLTDRVVGDLTGAEFPSATQRRHADALAVALDCVVRARHQLAQPELAAEDLRRAIQALERVTGAVSVEEVLGRVFSNFCIGK